MSFISGTVSPVIRGGRGAAVAASGDSQRPPRERGKHLCERKPRAPSKTARRPRDNVNIRLGFVIANYFSLFRSLSRDVIPAKPPTRDSLKNPPTLSQLPVLMQSPSSKTRPTLGTRPLLTSADPHPPPSGEIPAGTVS